MVRRQSCSDTDMHPDLAHRTDQEEGNSAHNDLSTNALSFSLSPTCQLHRWCAHPSPGQVSMPCQLSTSPSRARSGPCLAVKRPGVPRDPFARMPDVHFQGVRTARLVCSASRPRRQPRCVSLAGRCIRARVQPLVCLTHAKD